MARGLGKIPGLLSAVLNELRVDPCGTKATATESQLRILPRSFSFGAFQKAAQPQKPTPAENGGRWKLGSGVRLEDFMVEGWLMRKDVAMTSHIRHKAAM